MPLRRASGTLILAAIIAVVVWAVGAPPSHAAYPGTNGKIAYLSLVTSGTPSIQVFTVNSDGNGATQLTHDGTGNTNHPVWSPDGTKLAYVNGLHHIIVVDANGSNPVDVSNTSDTNIQDNWPTWSPDGTMLAFDRINNGDASPEHDIVVAASNGSTGTPTNLTAGAGTDSTEPAWSPSGSAIAFVRQQSSKNEIWSMGSNGSNQHVLTTVTQDAESPAWAPDGNKILFDDVLDLYTTDPSAASPGQTQLTNTVTFADRDAEYSPDGTKIIEQGTNGSNLDLYVLNANGTGATRITNGTYEDQPNWQPTAAANLTVSPAGSGAGTVASSPAGISCPGTCAFPYAPGTQVTLTATPSAGSYFAGWSGGGCSGAGTCTITLGADTAVTATFQPGYTLTVDNNYGGGTEILSTPAGIDCGEGGACSATFAPGSSVTLHQNTYKNGALFTGWIGGGCSGIGTCTLQMTKDTTVTGTWTYVPPPQSGTHAVAPLAFTAPAEVAYVGTEWTGYSTAISCPSSELCVAAGYMTDSATIAHKGIVITNTQSNHTSGWQAGVPSPDFNWTPPGDQWQLNAIACPSTSFCGAVDDQGDVFTTTDPVKGADTFGPNPQGVWQRTQNIDPIGNYSYHYTVGISCPSSGLCGVIDADGGLVYSTNTAAGAGTWTRTVLPGGSPTDISCPSPASCYVTDSLGNVIKSLTPSNSSTPAFAGAWQAMAVDPGGELDHITCVQGDCFAVDHAGNIWSSTNPAGGASAWTHVNLGSQFFTGISCSSPSFCAAVDNNGEAFVSNNPTGGASDWKSATVMPNHGLNGVSCASALVHLLGQQTWCVGISYDGNYVVGMIPELDVSRQGTGSGSVVSAPAGISCGSTCSQLFPAGTTVSLTATPNSNSAFSAWSSNCPAPSSQPLTCSINIDQPGSTRVVAVFSPTPVGSGGVVTFTGTLGKVTFTCKLRKICSGTVTLTVPLGPLARASKARKKPIVGKPIIIGKTEFHVKPHRRGIVKIRLTKTGRQLVHRHKLHRLTETITTKQPKHGKLVSVRTVKARY